MNAEAIPITTEQMMWMYQQTHAYVSCVEAGFYYSEIDIKKQEEHKP